MSEEKQDLLPEELRRHRDHLAELVAERTAKLAQRNRAYRVLSEANQAVVRATDEQTLLDDVCRVLTVEGNYALAWVGFMVDDEARTLRPVAWGGEEEGYLQGLQASWGENEYGRGPSGKAIRHKKPVVVRDIRSDPDFKQWQARAQRHGYVSVVSLPLLDEGQPFGILSIYASARDAFDGEELALLEELAGDLAYGILTLRTREQRRLTEDALVASEARLANVLELAPVGFITTDSDQRIVLFNRAAEEIFGYSAEEVTGKPLDILLPARYQQRHRAHVGKFAGEGTAVVPRHARPAILYGRRKSGEEFPVEVGISRTEIGDGAVLTAVVEDISARRQAETALEQSNTRLEVLNEIATRSGAEMEVKELIEHAVDRIHEHFPHYRVTYGTVDPHEQELDVIAYCKPPGMLPLREGKVDLSAVAGYLQVLQQGEAIVVEDMGKDAGLAAICEARLGADARALLAVPFRHSAALVGLLCFDAPQPQPWSEHELTTLREVADYLRLVLRDARLREERQQAQSEATRANNMLLALSKAAEDVQGAGTVEGVYEAVGRAVTGLGYQATIMRLSDDGRYLEPAYHNFDPNLLATVEAGKGIKLSAMRQKPIPAEYYEQLVTRRQSLFFADVLGPLAKGWPHIPRAVLAGAAALFKIEQMVIAPLAHDKGVVGTLVVLGRGLEEADVPAVATFASQAAIAIRNAELLVETKRLLSQSQMRARLMQQIMDTVPEGVLLLETNQRVALANPVGREYLALLADAGEQETVTALAGQPLAKLLQAATEGDTWQELALGARERIFEMAAEPLSIGSQRQGWVVVLREVTEARRTQQRVQEQYRLAAVGQLAAGIAHDFNNIMAVITLYSEALERDPEMGQRLHYLHTIRKQANHASNLIGQILDFSRASVMEMRPLDLGPVLKELVKVLQRTLPESISIVLENEAGAHMVEADPTRLQQAVMNLAVNGRDAMPSGGRLTFSLDHLHLTQDDLPPLPELRPGHWVRLAVADSGSGIPEHQLPHIFEPFFTMKAPGKGTGLGLAQVYGIVKQHGGEIAVSSGVGQGTIFTVYLPEVRSSRDAIFDKSRGLAAGMVAEGKTILVVEDNDSAREAIAETLDLFGFDVLRAPNGYEALDLLRRLSRQVSLVISDVMMPEMGGLELYERLREEQLDVKFIFVSGYPWDSELRKRIDAGTVRWVAKPFSADQLVSIVNEALG